MLLVTTPIQETWGGKEEILFLGEWCKLYRQKDILLKRNHSTLPYHWDDRKKLADDFQNLQNLRKKVLSLITVKLNEIHKVNFSERYWNILVGYWLWLFIAVIYDRWTMIQKADTLGLVSYSYAIKLDDETITPNTIKEAIDFITSDLWNHAVYSLLLEKWTSIELRPIDIDQRLLSGLITRSKNSTIKKIISIFAHNKFNVFARDNDSVFIKSGIPIPTEIALQFKLGQFPIIRSNLKKKEFVHDSSYRQWNLSLNGSSRFEEIVGTLIPKFLPRIFLEGYKELNRVGNNSNMPTHPKMIFSLNAHYIDEHFSVYAADKTEKDSKLVLLEHGGYGCNAFNGAVNYQLDISDASLSWGWKDSSQPNVKPLGILKLTGKSQRWDKSGFGLMVLNTLPRYSFDLRAMPIAGQMLQYFQDQFKFYSHLPTDIKDKILVRLYSADYDWDQKKRWEDTFPDIHLDHGKKSISKLVSKSRLFISTYNATTYLESLAYNIPTLIYWDRNYWELHERSIEYFDLLIEAGIFHETPESAAAKVIEIWDDVSQWWYNDNLQKTRAIFCENFARSIKKPANQLRDLLISI